MRESEGGCAVKQMTAIDQEVENIGAQLNRIEKTISVCLENFRRFDNPANKLNPEDYFRNQPNCVSEPDGKDRLGSDGKPCDPYVRSGLVLKLNELSLYAKQLEERLAEFNEQHVVPVGMFFERNV